MPLSSLYINVKLVVMLIQSCSCLGMHTSTLFCVHRYMLCRIWFTRELHSKTPIPSVTYYSLIAFDERVTFLASTRLVTALCVWYAALFVRRLAYNHYAIAHAYNAANAHAQGSDRARWSQKVTLSSKAIGVQAQWLHSDWTVLIAGIAITIHLIN